MSKAVFTEASFNDVKGYTISLDIKPEGEIGLVSVEYDTRNLRAELVNEEAGSVSGYLVGVRSDGSIISFDVLARDIKDLGRYSVVVNYDLVLMNGKTKAITIEEYVFEVVRIEEKPALGGGLAVHTVVRGITSGTGATSEASHDGNVEELSRKLEVLTQEIQTLKQKAETSASDKPTEYPNLFELVKEYNRLASYEYRGEDKPETVRDFLARYPKGTAKVLFNQMLNEFFNFSNLGLREDDANMLDLIAYAFYVFAENIDDPRMFREFYTEDGDMNVSSFFKNIKQISVTPSETDSIAFSFLKALVSWANPDDDPRLELLTERYSYGDTSNPFLDGKDLGTAERAFGEHWESVEKALIVFKTIILLYATEDPIGAMLVYRHRTFEIE